MKRKNVFKRLALLACFGLLLSGESTAQNWISYPETPTLLRNLEYSPSGNYLNSFGTLGTFGTVWTGGRRYWVEATLSNSTSHSNSEILSSLQTSLLVNGVPLIWGVEPGGGVGDIDGGHCYKDMGWVWAQELTLGYELSFFNNGKFRICDHVTIGFAVYDITPGPDKQVLVDYKYVDVYLNPYAASIADMNTPDLFMSDKEVVMFNNTNTDHGIEPFAQPLWNFDYRQVTQSTDIWNRTDKDYYSPDFEGPMSSVRTPPQANRMFVEVTNRSCAQTEEASMYMYWTIARLFEPWARDWLNFNRAPYANNNYINYTEPGSTTPEKKPLGNEITIENIYDYSSAVRPVTVMSLPPGTSTGYLNPNAVTHTWIVPQPKWYLNQTTLPIQIRHGSTTEPVICLLARLEEPWKDQKGFPFNPSWDAGTQLVDYAYQNNNVVTRNTYITNSKNGYKRLSDYGNGDWGTGTGTIAVTPGEPVNGICPPLNIGIINDNPIQGTPMFTNYGRLLLYLDRELWQAWLSGGMQGINVSVVEPQVIQVTNSNYAVLQNISMRATDMYWIAATADLYGDAPPAEDFEYTFSLGAMNPQFMSLESPKKMIGTPSHFFVNVLKDPRMDPAMEVDESGRAYRTKATGPDDKASEASAISVFPDPSSGSFGVFLKASVADANGQILVYDMQGKVVKELPVQVREGDNLFSVELGDVPGGMYVVRWISEGCSSYAKIVVEGK